MQNMRKGCPRCSLGHSKLWHHWQSILYILLYSNLTFIYFILFFSILLYIFCVEPYRRLSYVFSSFILMRKCDILYLQWDSSFCCVRGFFLLSWRGGWNVKNIGWDKPKLQILTPWKPQAQGITGCKNHKETLCMLWVNPVIFTDSGETPW